ncbi:MAG: hypothetical protein JEZ03_18555 [Bacteroidales bacterium]|nr:hypothetical protein [Bacteroidales bacterium]
MKAFIAISVEDSGLGMSQEYMDSLFKVGKNTSIPGTDNEQGTGFCLVLCKEFVEANGGILSFSSQLDKGSVFTFSLPVFLES